MSNLRGIRDVCDDINEVLEDYERDRKIIDINNVYDLKTELCDLINVEENQSNSIDGSFVELVCHLQDAVHEENPLDIQNPNINGVFIGWDQFPIYVGLYQSICDVFPRLNEERLTFGKFHSYDELIKTENVYAKSMKVSK